LINFLTCAFEALPFLTLQLARSRSRVPTIVNKISKRQKNNSCSYHNAPPVTLSLNINAKVAAQMLVRAITFKIARTRINMSFITVVKVILGSIVSHSSTSMGCIVSVCFP
jgi:hypothetical protein